MESVRLSRGRAGVLIVGVLVLGLGGAALWGILHRRVEEEPRTSDPARREGLEGPSSRRFGGAQPVSGVEVVRDTLRVRVVASGTAEAYRRTMVTTRRGGVVETAPVRENDLVRRGQVMIRLDTLEAHMAVAEAQARLRSAENRFEAGMLAGGEIEDPAVQKERERNLRIRVGWVEAETALRRAELEMDRTRVAAPFAGRVANLATVEGEFLPAGSEVLTLVQLDPIRVQVGVLESELRYLREGSGARVRFAALPDTTFSASVESVNPLVDPGTRSGRVTLVTPNPDHRIKPGMYATVRVDARAFPDRILIPREAVVERGEPRREVVFVLRDLDEAGRGRSEWRYVATGRGNEDEVEVLASPGTDGVRPGEIVLVDGHHYLAHDVPVRLVDGVVGTGER